MSLKELIRPLYLKWLYFPLQPGRKPPEWRACWEFPVVQPEGLPPGVDPDILILPMTDWHVRIQRPHHLARAFARMGRRCFYLNPHLGREFSQPVRWGTAERICRLEDGIYEIHLGLPREPVFHHRLLSGRESEHLAAALDRLLPRGPLAVVTQFPLWNAVVGRLKESREATVLYDCHDLLSGFSRISPEIVAAENALYQQADVVVFTARSLMDQQIREMPWLAEKSHLVRNGVDVGHFQPVAGGRRKVVGYAGSLDEWFDVEAVRLAAERFPQCQFVLLGRIEDRRVLALEAIPNVRFYGEIPYDHLPRYLGEFDVALIPFLLTPLTAATNPIKLYEYFSCGLPVVSTNLPEVMEYGDLVRIARSPAKFAEQVGAALDDTDPALRARRRTLAESQSWDARAKDLAGLLGNLPAQRAGSTCGV